MRGVIEDECGTAGAALQAGVNGRIVFVTAVVIENGERQSASRMIMDPERYEQPSPHEHRLIAAGLADALVEQAYIYDPER